MAQIQDKKIIVGLNSDWDDKVLPPGDYRYAQNLHIGSSDDENVGSGENIKGNTLVNFTLPTDTNKVIGKYEDKKNKTIIYFVYNDSGSHGIYQYFPENGVNGTIEKILVSSLLNFDKDYLITGVNLVDGKLLYWTDGINPQRKINIEKANNTNKKSEINVYFDTESKTSARFAGFFYVNIYDPDGNPTHTIDTGGIIVSDQDTKKEFIDEFVSQFNNLGAFNTYFAASACEEYVELVSENGLYTIEVKEGPPGTGIDVISVAQNYYPTPFKEEYIDVLKYPPNCQPSATYQEDTDFNFNFVSNKVFQFRAMYKYDDNEKSALGPISTIADDKISCGTDPNESPNNYIEVDYTDTRLNDAGSLAILKSVELFVRETNLGKWKSIKVIDQENFSIGQNIHRFYNDGITTAIDDPTANKLSDAIPLTSKSQEFMKNRLFYGGNKEGYECPCIDTNLSLSLANDKPQGQETGTVTGRIRINNFFHKHSAFRNQQPIWRSSEKHPTTYAVFGGFGVDQPSTITQVDTRYNQILPEGGFVVYLAGTNFFDISKQNDFAIEITQASCPNCTKTPDFDDEFRSKNVYDGTDPGGQLLTCKCNKSGRALMELAITEAEVYSTFEIKNVPPGTYILRVASHYCSHGDKLGNRGSIYDLDDPNLGWQKTSTYVHAINGIRGKKEIIVTVAANGTFNVSEILIADLSTPTTGNFSTAWSGYLYDRVWSEVDLHESIKQGNPMELQTLHFVEKGFGFTPELFEAPRWFEQGSVGPPITTDHNGFWFGAITSNWKNIFEMININEPYRVGVASVSGDITDPNPLPQKTNGGLRNTRIVRGEDWDDQLLAGNLGMLLDGTNLTPEDRLHKTNDHMDYVLYNHNKEVSDICRTTVKGTVINSVTGKGVSGISVIIQGTHAGETTESNGEFTILVYGDANENLNKRLTQLILSYGGPCIVTIADQVTVIDVSQFQQTGNYNETEIFELAQDLNLSIVDDEVLNSLKRGGKYEFALEYLDRGNRSTTVCDGKEVYIPFYTEDLTKFGFSTSIILGRPSVNWDILSKPPIWATHYQWVRTKNLLYNRYLQFVIDEVEYHVDSDSDPTTFESKQAKEIYIKLAITKYASENSGTTVGFVPEKGDRIRFIIDKNDDVYTQFFDLEIREQRGEFLVIKLIEDLPKIEPGAFVEVLTPKLQSDDKLFYEFGECYKIDNPHTSSREHSKLTGTFGGGDVWYRPRVMRYENSRTDFFVEDQKLSDFIETNDENIGRINIIDNDAGEIDRPTNIRFGGVFLPGTKINGLNSFDALNSDDVPRDAGLIEKLVQVGNVMLAICHNSQTISLYIGESMLTDVAGQQVVAISDKVLSSQRVLIGGWGTQNPESVAVHEHRAYFYDRYKGKPVRYSQDGMTAISDGEMKMRDHFADLGKILSLQDNIKIYGEYDRDFGEYILSHEGFIINNNIPNIITEDVGNKNNPYRTTKLNTAIVTDEQWDEFWALGDINRDGYINQDDLDILADAWLSVPGDANWDERADLNEDGVVNGADLQILISSWNLNIWDFFGITVTNSYQINPQTIAFNEASNRWTTFYSFTPEFMARSGLTFVSFKDGKLYLHNNEDALRNTFYGVFGLARIHIVSNKEPSATKVFESISVESNKIWTSPSIFNTLGQESELIAQDFIQRENDFHAAILRDKNTPNVTDPLLNGDNMRDKVVEILLENNSEDFCKLFAVNIYSLVSELSNR